MDTPHSLSAAINTMFSFLKILSTLRSHDTNLSCFLFSLLLGPLLEFLFVCTALKCLCLPGFIPCVDGGSPRLEQVCTLLLLMLSQMLFSSGGQDSHPLRVWPTPAAWSIFSEWIKINTMMFTIKCVKTRLPGLGVKE